jgi:hypothetical protein
VTIDPELPPPFEVPWTMKPLESADTHVEVLPDGRRKYAIVHDVVRDVTPAMIVWWLKHMDGEVEIAGRVIPRYRAWHPRDHVSVRYARRAHDGSNMGPGSRVHIRESFGREARYRVDVVDDVLRLDEGGFVHVHRRAGVELVRMEYTFEAIPGGTRYRNFLIAGTGSRFLRPLDALVARRFPDAMGRRWLLHNVEEVGNLERFLPALYEAERVRGERG